MRVLITTSAEADLWQYVATLATELAARHAVEVLIVSIGRPPDSEQLSMIGNRLFPGGGAIEFDTRNFPHEADCAPLAAYEEAREELLRVALKWRTHVLHVNEHHFGEISDRGMPVVLVSHQDLCSRRASVEGESPPLVDPSYSMLVRHGLLSSAAVVAPSTYVAESLGKWLSYRGVVRIIPYGISQHPGALAAIRTVDAITYGPLGDPAWNFTCYQSAAMRLRDRSLSAIGNPLDHDEHANVQPYDRVQYIKSRSHDEIRQHLGRAKLFVSAAIYDPSGTHTVEAALAGCSLILSNISSYRALWDDAAVYFDPRDPAALREQISAQLSDVSQRHVLANLARERAISLYGAGRMADSYLATYQRLALRYGLAT